MSKGAQEVFNYLGDACEMISPSELAAFTKAGLEGKVDPHKLYGCVIEEEWMVCVVKLFI